MDFDLTSEQAAIFAMARAFARDRLAPHALQWDEDRYLPLDVLREAASLGMGGICVCDTHGGSGLSRLESTLIFEGLGYGCPTIGSFISIHNICATMIDRYGDEAQKRQHLPALCSMAKFASYCLTEPSSGSDAASLRTTAQRQGDCFILNGSKSFISGAGISDLYVVMARTGGPGPKGISTLLVEKSAPGLSFGKLERKMGWNAQPTAQVHFENCRVPAGNVLGREGEGFRYAMASLDGGRLNIAAGALGAAQAAFDKTVAHLKQRQAFGKPLAENTALQFRLADMDTELAASRVLLRQAAVKLDRTASDATAACAMAKRFVTDAAFRVANEALQLHGGYGYLADYGIEKIVRDLRVHQILEGTNEIMRLIIARHVLSRDDG